MKRVIPEHNFFTQQRRNLADYFKMAKYINRFTTVPKELFRLNNGPAISLRDRTVKKTGSYDILSEAGQVKPKAITNPEVYESMLTPDTSF